MQPSKQHLAHQLRNHPLVAAFVQAPGTEFAPNAFPVTTAGAVRQVWGQRAFEFRCTSVQSTGLTPLLEAVAALNPRMPLRLYILRSGPHTAHLFTSEAGDAIVGAVLYGATLPDLKLMPARQRRTHNPGGRQLDLFAVAS